jgi:hypothetical protein
MRSIVDFSMRTDQAIDTGDGMMRERTAAVGRASNISQLNAVFPRRNTGEVAELLDDHRPEFESAKALAATCTEDS